MIRKMKLWLAALLVSANWAGQVQTRGQAPANISLRNEVEHAMDRGIRWLEKNQHPEGYWSTPDHPAVTALCLTALQGGSSPAKAEVLQKGYAFVLGCVKPDGSISGKGELVNYNTALSVVALVAAKNPDYKPVIARAREFLIRMQIDLGEPGQVDTPFDGGVGYGSKYKHSDMGNTLAALEALYLSKQLFADEGLAAVRDLNWAAAVNFIQNCQNLPGTNKQEWVSGDPQNKGGFVYYPGHSMAGTTNLPSGRVALRSYGSISYGGLLSYIYAQLKKDDPRVQAVFNWLRENFTLEENPGMGPQGLYFYFHTMAKALANYGVDDLELKDGRRIPWRKELALRLMNLQRADGSWMNDNARWWEKDSALVTAYGVIVLEIVRRGL